MGNQDKKSSLPPLSHKGCLSLSFSISSMKDQHITFKQLAIKVWKAALCLVQSGWSCFSGISCYCFLHWVKKRSTVFCKSNFKQGRGEPSRRHRRISNKSHDWRTSTRGAFYNHSVCKHCLGDFNNVVTSPETMAQK